MSIIPVTEIAERFGIKPTGIIHVGAHEGQEVAEYVALGLKKICLIEANARHYDKLLELQRQHSEISIDMVAVSDREGTAELNVTTESQSSSILPLARHLDIYPGIKPVEKVLVHTKTLDSMFDDEQLAQINVLNIDVQGAELLVLMGAKRVLKSIDLIISEVNFEELYEGCPPIEEVDRFLFDLGFVRVETRTPYHPSWGDAAYVRSCLIKDVSFDRLQKRYGVSMSSLGSNGRFANQLFQYVFLVLYGLRSGCTPYAPEFEAAKHLRANVTLLMKRKYLALPWLKSAESSFLVTSRPPKDVDFWGYFQSVTAAHRTHKSFIKELLRPSPQIEDVLTNWIGELRQTYRRLIGLHIRRGDYVPYDANSLHNFSRVPTEFYLSWLKKHAGVGDGIFISTDSKEELSNFSEYALINKSPRPTVLEGVAGEFFTLSQCDVAAYCNSSWSLMAALLAERQQAYIIDFKAKDFVGFDPWKETNFWRRFAFNGDEVASLSDHDQQVDFLTHYAKVDRLLAFPLSHSLRYLWSRVLGGKWMSKLSSALHVANDSKLRRVHLAARGRYIQYKKLCKGPFKAG